MVSNANAKDLEFRAKLWQYKQKHPKSSPATIGRIFKISRQRVWRILKEEQSTHEKALEQNSEASTGAVVKAIPMML